MYDDTMQAIDEYLIKQSETKKMTYTAELIPERHPNGEMYEVCVYPCLSFTDGP